MHPKKVYINFLCKKNITFRHQFFFMKKLRLSDIKKHLLTVVFLCFSVSNIFSQTVQITANPGASASSVMGNRLFFVSECIYTEAEIGAATFTSPANAINHIDFNVSSVGANTTVNNFNLYLKEVPAGAETFTAGVYNTTGYTLVFSGTYSPSLGGWSGVDLSTSFVRTSGNNLQLLIERLDSVVHTGFQFRTAQGNNNGIGLTTCRRQNTDTRPVPGSTNIGTASSFSRPQIQLRHIFPNDAVVSQIYTLGKLPIPFAVPHIIAANVTNNGSQVITNLDVTLAIAGANTFNDVQNIASLAPGSSITVSFAAFNPVNTGTNSISVSVPADDFTADNSMSVRQIITNSTYSYAYGKIPSGSLGITAGLTQPKSGDIVGKFTSGSPASVSQVGVTFTRDGVPFKVGIWDKSGSGVPGNLLWESNEQLTTVGVFTMPVSPSVSVNDTFFVGVRQTTTSNVQFAYETETPIRKNTFFFDTLSKATWQDFALLNGTFKFMIEPRLTIANDVGVSAINNPIATKAVDNCGLVPKVLVSNYGNNNQSSPFDVTYLIKQSGAVVYSDTKQVALNSGASQELSFAAFATSASGTDSSFCYTSLASDIARDNDTIVNVFNTGNYSYGGGAAINGGYELANSTACAAPSSFKPVYNWITETTSEINWGSNGDDSITLNPINLPFSFPYFGLPYSKFWVCSNGWISFKDSSSISPASQKTPVAIPATSGIQNFIAGMLADLDLTPGTYPDAHVYYGGDATQYVVTFFHAHVKSSASYISFQIVLKPDGNIFIQYNDAETTAPIPSSILNFCSIGIQNATGNQGVQYRLNGSFGSMFGSPLAVQFRPPGIVPVTLQHFSAQRIFGTNKITWTTSQELNSSYFVIERSNDGSTYLPVGKVDASGNSSIAHTYTFTDNNPVKGINFYRLQMVDKNNLIKYGPVRSIRNEGLADVSVYPNPLRDKMNISISADKKSPGTITVTDNKGQLLYSKTIIVAEGQSYMEINAAALSAGMYIVKLQLGGDVVIKKINKL
jgi:hypothetical protein